MLSKTDLKLLSALAGEEWKTTHEIRTELKMQRTTVSRRLAHLCYIGLVEKGSGYRTRRFRLDRKTRHCIVGVVARIQECCP